MGKDESEKVPRVCCDLNKIINDHWEVCVWGGKRVIIKAVKTLLYLDLDKLILKLMLATLMFIVMLFTIAERWKQPSVHSYTGLSG